MTCVCCDGHANPVCNVSMYIYTYIKQTCMSPFILHTVMDMRLNCWTIMELIGPLYKEVLDNGTYELVTTFILELLE